MVSSITVFLTIILCVWLVGVMYALHSMSSGKNNPITHTVATEQWTFIPGSNDTGTHTITHLRRVGSPTQPSNHPAEKQSAAELEVLGNEVLQEILEEAARHPVSKGERPEWQEHVGVGRREPVGLSGQPDQKQHSRGHDHDSHTDSQAALPATEETSHGVSHLLSRTSSVKVTCDTRGNLGPCTVVNQGEATPHISSVRLLHICWKISVYTPCAWSLCCELGN